MTLKLFNTLGRKIEAFKPLKDKQVGMYSCGPTVYNYAHIGNLRNYVFNDLLKRSLIYLGFKVNHVMNVTDVDDKTIKGSTKEKLPLKEFTRKYENIFFNDLKSLDILKPNHVLRATESISDMVKMIQTLLKKGIAYKTSDGIYFSINKSKDYGKLALLDKLNETKERISADEYDKSNPHDFALWKFWTEEDGKVFWETAIGKGRPGWHIECSAMSMKILGETLDIHTGGTDLIFPHHTNEIAQSEAYTGKKFVNYWIHGGFLTMKEGKMSKSIGNILTMNDLKNKGFSPLDFRYLCLLTHYRMSLQFSDDTLEAAKTAYDRLKNKVLELKKDKFSKPAENNFKEQFEEAISDDLNISKALGITWEAINNKFLGSKQKLALIKDFDKVLGLNLDKVKEEKLKIPKEIQELVNKREEARKKKDFKKSDELRTELLSKGYAVEDSKEGLKIKKI